MTLKTMSIRLPEAVHATLKAEADERRVPMNAIIIEALRDRAGRRQKARERGGSHE
jgi:predicted HicB family RNase H-like nuclease